MGWARAKQAGWRRRSRPEQVETHTRGTLLCLPWLFCLVSVPQLIVVTRHSTAGTVLAWVILVLALAQCALALPALRRALDSYVRRGAPPRRLTAALAALLFVFTALMAALIAIDALDAPATAAVTMFAVMLPWTAVYSLSAPLRRATASVAGYTAGVVGVFALAGLPAQALAGTAALMLLSALVGVFSPRSSAWYIAVLRELEEARETQARLAVAEERLRFGRDLHDVMGRNLSVIALKSELAVQLARRDPAGTDGAVDQMEEVQRLARESQTEVRDVVRGYREAGLTTELAGARGVLRAAGVDCRIEGDGEALSDDVQSALGWVVREGATNVLRHADATRCTVRLDVAPRSAVLLVENDGAAPGAPRRGGGSGLPGLRERLAALDGTLTTERPQEGVFRLRATVPLADDTDTREVSRGGRAAHPGSAG
ncbi:hypothetical protein G5C65_17825 [Streptomyces sp. SB3404]|uniref:Signal transduction histidine kinase subgroup 3 dimerisation and phosphoacceptor domain-containing protein n=1 Tax=Streptomyces boncukensis TaxID=2711219 RepID=A0A6G4WZZ1_9ACTN|nr:hypothetical protein [Streptomyces boncukensis]